MCTRPIQLRDRPVGEKLPCGYCLECRKSYARGWAVRCLFESRSHMQNCFGTLTYDEDHLPKYGTLVKKDFQDFMKRLRKSLEGGNLDGSDKRVKYYACGEYGTKNKRPHYHFLLFGHDFDRVREMPSDSGFPVYSSAGLSMLWKDGLAVVGDVSFASTMYVTQYILQYADNVVRRKKYSCDEDGVLHEIEKEFGLMSRGGRKWDPSTNSWTGGRGIGYDWYSRFSKEIERHDNVVVDGSELPVPRYYDSLLKERDALLYEEQQLRRLRKAGRLGKRDFSEERRDALAREAILRSKVNDLNRRI